MDTIVNGNMAIVVQRTELNGKSYVDVRNFYTDRADGKLKPTKKGVMIPLDLVGDVMEAIASELADKPKKAAKKPAKTSTCAIYVRCRSNALADGKLATVSAEAVFDTLKDAVAKPSKYEAMYVFKTVSYEEDSDKEAYRIRKGKLVALWSSKDSKWVRPE